MQKIRTAIVGTGFMGKVHAESAGIPFATDQLKDVLENKEIAAVHICTPNVDHFPMSLAAVEAGKAVLCEKPMTMNVDEARRLVEAAKSKNAVNCVQHNLRYYPAVQQIRQMIAHGDLGEGLIVQG